MNRLIVAVLFLAGGVDAQANPGQRLSPRQQAVQELRRLRGKAAEATHAIHQLMRKRIAWDLLLPIGDRSVFEVEEEYRQKSLEELQAILQEESRSTNRLKARLDSLHAALRGLSGGQLDVEEQRPSTTVERATGEIVRQPETEGIRRSEGTGLQVADAPEAEAPKAQEKRLGPRADVQIPPGPRLEPPLVAGPFARDGQVRLEISRSTYVIKRLVSLIDAGMPEQARIEIDELIRTQGEDPRLLFLKGRALEFAGRREEAVATYGRVKELDTIERTDGQKVAGPWGTQADFALKHLDWLARQAAMPIPDVKEIKW